MASNFSEDTSISLPGVFYSSVTWSDYNADGKQDFLLMGLDNSFSPISKLYKNTGSGFSEDTSISLPSVYDSSVTWADYNGDGKPDFLLTGFDNSYNPISKLYKNTDSGFIEDNNISLPGLYNGSAAWADYTGDGKQDFLLTGLDNSYNYISKLYKNTGSGFIEDTSISLPGVFYSSVAWADYTGDGKLDLLLTGFDNSYTPISKLYKNTDSGFIEDTSISLPGIYNGSVTWSDYTGDGKPDFLLTGFDSSYTPISKLYKNTDSGFIEDTSISLPAISYGSVTWSDYNGDGKPDLLLTGIDNSYSPISKLYENTGSGFNEDTSISLPGVVASSVAWADYTEDGKPDLLLTGLDSSYTPISKLYKYTTTTVSDTTPPTANSFTPNDNATEVAIDANLVINFNEAIQKATGDIVIKKLSDDSVVETLDVTTGDVIVNGSQLTINPTTDLTHSTDYYLEIPDGAIQDLAGNNYAGISGNSTWNFQTQAPQSLTEDMNISLPGVEMGSVAWADYNGDGKQDFLLTGATDSGYISKLYKNTGNGFSEDTSISLPGVELGSVAWADYNGDGKQDFLLTGLENNSYTLISKLYQNTGSGFTEDTSISLPGVYYSSVAWSDYNGDGKPDFVLTGLDDSYTFISKLYQNTGSGFTEDTSISLPGVYSGSVTWEDYNGDGKPDLLLTGSDDSFNLISKLYENTGSGFTENTNISLPGVYSSSVAWADYNGDTKPDLLLTGYSASGQISKLYENTGSGFTENTNLSLPGVYSGSVAWTDYNGDNKPDILLTGATDSELISKLYKNTGSDFIEDTNISLPGVLSSSIAWADYSGDSKPDLLLTGYSMSGAISKLYENTTV